MYLLSFSFNIIFYEKHLIFRDVGLSPLVQLLLGLMQTSVSLTGSTILTLFLLYHHRVQEGL